MQRTNSLYPGEIYGLEVALRNPEAKPRRQVVIGTGAVNSQYLRARLRECPIKIDKRQKYGRRLSLFKRRISAVGMPEHAVLQGKRTVTVGIERGGGRESGRGSDLLQAHCQWRPPPSCG